MSLSSWSARICASGGSRPLWSRCCISSRLIRAALAGDQSHNIEIQNPAGRWLSLRILPYRGPTNAIDGAVATLIDIDDLKRARDFAEAVVGVVREPLIVLDAALRVRTAN